MPNIYDQPQGGFADILGAGAQGAPQGPQPGQMAPVVNGPDPVVQQLVNPPANPEEYSARQAKWTQLLQDPRLQNALLFFGASATAPLGFNESPLHRGLASAATGATAYQLTDLAGQDQDIQRRRASREEAQTDANIRRLDAGTMAVAEEAEQRRELQPGAVARQQAELRRLDQQIKSAVTMEEKAALEIKREKILIDIEEKTGLEKAQADIAARKAQAGASSASAAANVAHARVYGAEAAQRETINRIEQKILAGETVTPGEKEILARHRASKGDTQSANVLLRNEKRESLKKAFPEMAGDEAALERMLIKWEQSKAGANFDAIKAALDSGDKALEDRAKELLREQLGVAGSTPGAVTKKGETPAQLAPAEKAALLKGLQEGQTYAGKYIKRGNEIYNLK